MGRIGLREDGGNNRPRLDQNTNESKGTRLTAFLSKKTHLSGDPVLQSSAAQEEGTMHPSVFTKCRTACGYNVKTTTLAAPDQSYRSKDQEGQENQDVQHSTRPRKNNRRNTRGLRAAWGFAHFPHNSYRPISTSSPNPTTQPTFDQGYGRGGILGPTF